MRIFLDETLSKCSHIILRLAGKKIVTTKQALMGPDLIDVKNLEANILLNKLRVEIRKSGTTDWAEIKRVVEARRFSIDV